MWKRTGRCLPGCWECWQVGLLKGKTMGIDATTLEANAAMRTIVRRDNGESYEEFLTDWPRRRGSRRRREKTWPGSTGSGRRRLPMRNG